VLNSKGSTLLEQSLEQELFDMMRFSIVLLVVYSIVGANAFVVNSPSFGVTSSSSLQMTVLTYKGKKKDFKPGSPLSRAAAQLGVPVKYSCKK